MIRSTALAILLLLAQAAPTLAWSGRILDETGHPIPGATVSILGRTGETLTDANGRFDWLPDPAPPFEILVILADGRYMRPVAVEALGEGTVDITVHPLLNEAVTVSGSAPGIASTPASGTTTISGRDVDLRQPSNLMQALENVAGVNQVSEGQAAVPAIRGLARGRTLILIDGARVTAERRVGPSATYVDPAIVEGVDVSRGPGSVAYGSDTFGGVIAIRTLRAAPGSPWEARMEATGGAGIPQWRLMGRVSKGLPAGSVLVAVHARQADDWRSPSGDVFNSGFEDRGVLARVEQKAGNGFVSVGWQSDFGRNIDRPRNNSGTVRFSYPFENSHRFTAAYEHAGLGGFRRVIVNTFLGSYGQRTDQDRFATATAGRTIERADVSAGDFGVRASGERLLGRARLEAGLDLNGRFGLEAIDDLLTYDLSGALIGTRPIQSIESAGRADTGLYASIDTALGSVLSIGAGLRGDYVVTRNRGGYFGDRSTGNGGGSGYAALTAGSFRGLSTTVQLARGFRDPTLSDRYYRGPTGRGFITGNPDLDPETSLQFDWAVRYAGPRARVAAYYYHYRIRDLIERFPAGDDNFLFRNRGAAVIRGFEVEAQVDLGSGFAIDLATQIAEGETSDTGASLDDIAPFTFTTVVRKTFGARAFGQARLALFANDDQPGPTERAVPGYTMLDLQAGYQVAEPIELRLQARNLLNEEYFASQDPRAILAPGRSATLTLAIGF